MNLEEIQDDQIYVILTLGALNLAVFIALLARVQTHFLMASGCSAFF